MKTKRSGTIWRICLTCLSCALYAGCDRLAALPEWEEWAAGEATLITGASVESGAPVDDLSFRSGRRLAIDDSAFRAIRHDDPRAVVEAFLEAVKRADNHVLHRLMSHRCLATCESDGLELVISRPSPVAEYRVFHAEYVPDNRKAAHVRCLWSDAQSTRDFIFVLRNESGASASSSRVQAEGVSIAGAAVWRIAGLAVPGSHRTEIFDLESSGDLSSLVVQ